MISFLRPKLKVQATLELVTFKQGERSVAFVPRIYLKSESEPVVLAVGEPANPVTDGVRCDLFAETPSAFDRSELLEAFFRHGCQSVFKPGFARRPAVEIVVSSSLKEFLRGYHRIIFTQAAACLSGDAEAVMVRVE